MRTIFHLRFGLISAALLTGLCVAKDHPAPRVINLTAHDGTILKATYFPAAKPGPGVLLLHQCDGQRKQWDVLAEHMAKAGINVLTLDYRGFGESGGAPYDKMEPPERRRIVTEVWPGDMEIAYSYLVWQAGVQRDKIGAGGASCGVNNAIQLARRHSDIKSLMLLSGPTDREGRLFLRSSRLPLFTGAADDDKYRDSVEVTEWLYGVSPNPASRFAHYTTGHHGAEMFVPHPEMAGTVTDWFNATLKGHPERAPKVEGTGLDPQIIRTLDRIDEPGGASEVAKKLAAEGGREPKSPPIPEAFVNQLGYEHVQIGDKQGAIEIMKLNVAAYPNSPNAYDSLSDVYLADGENDLALLNAKKALELLEKDTTDTEERKNGIRGSANDKVKQLKTAAK